MARIPVDRQLGRLLLCGRQLDNIDYAHLYLHDHAHASGIRALVVGEVLWDEFPDCARLGGAPLNFAVQLQRLHHAALLVSAVGADARGDEARSAIAAFGLDTNFLLSTTRYKTGTAIVRLGAGGQTSFSIERPAAYDAVALSTDSIRAIVRWDPKWLYYGTLFPSSVAARVALEQLLNALPDAIRFYDPNLRPGFESPQLVDALLRNADVVKLNERELRFVHARLDLPADPEGFCRAGAERYGWRAACVTLGAQGCAMLLGAAYTEAPGCPIDVADPVGAGDAFAAAFVHGLAANWSAEETAHFANRVGAVVASARGAIPEVVAGTCCAEDEPACPSRDRRAHDSHGGS